MPRRPRGDDGALAVEFSLIFPLLVFILIWAVYGGFYAYYRVTAEHDVQQAVRRLVFTSGFTFPDGKQLVFPATTNQVTDQNGTTSLAGAALALHESNPGFTVDPSDITWSYTCAATNSECADPQSGDLVTVTATFPTPVLDTLKWFFLGAANSVKVTVSASGRVE